MSRTADPQDLRSEEALLGAILVSPAAAKKVDVDATDFYRESYGKVWDAAIRCSNNGGCDVVTVTAELERRGQLGEIKAHNLTGRDAVAAIAANVPAPGNAKAYAERVKETSELRKFRRLAQSVIDGVQREDKSLIARALDALGQRVLYVDVDSGEAVETCPTCDEKDGLLEKKEHRERSLLSQISKLEGKAERKAREHKHWDEIQAVFDWYRLATCHFDVKFTAEEFNQALPRWKQYGKGRANPCKPALKAICGIAYEPSTTRGRNGKPRKFDKWELLNRNQFSWPDFHGRVPGETDNDWWRTLINLIEANLA